MNKKEAESLSNELLVADALLRLKTVENLLIAKGVFTKEEFLTEMESVTRQIARTLLENANVQGNLDELIDSLKPAKGN
jgi:hypothetical protein